MLYFCWNTLAGQFYFILCFEMCKQLVAKPHSEREVRVYNGDLGAEPPAESRGTAELMVRGSEGS